MTANVGELKSAATPLAPGKPNCGWLNKLKNSVRKSIRIPSRGTKCLMIEKSVFTKSGPESGVRFALPSCPVAGCEKQAGLNHSESVGLLKPGLQVLLGRMKLCALLFWKFTPDVLALSITNIGNPDVAFSITVTSHPPAIAFAAPFQLLPHFRPLPNGRS